MYVTKALRVEDRSGSALRDKIAIVPIAIGDCLVMEVIYIL